ncbi:MAG: hypothetical protein K6T83_07490 [Alicyclobacillus sp.]|nr:hypothetical protein [Alicyclobacillus sp.]
MGQFLPDWMFAAFAIGGWELFDLVARRWRMPKAHWVGAGIVIVCLCVLGIRYLTRYIRKRRHPEMPDPDEWKRF